MRDLVKERAYQKAWKAANRERIRLQCAERRLRNKSSLLVYEAKWRKDNIARRLLTAARWRAGRKGIPFTLAEPLPVPELCPVCSVSMEIGTGRPTKRSPSLDRIIPAIGYTHQNSWIICNGCNQTKSAITPEMMLLILRELRSRGLFEGAI